jgi:hypothetical protein
MQRPEFQAAQHGALGRLRRRLGPGQVERNQGVDRRIDCVDSGTAIGQ